MVAADQVSVGKVDRDKGAISPEVKENVWIRSAGRCECTAACGHHAKRCATKLYPGFWSIRSILPAWAGGVQDRLSMFEAVCDRCREHPAVRVLQSPGMLAPTSQALANLAKAIQDT